MQFSSVGYPGRLQRRPAHRRTSGRAHPGFVVSHHGSRAGAPGFYDAFDRRANGIVMAVLNP